MMAKVTFLDPIGSVHGRICAHRPTIYKVSPAGKNFTSMVCNHRNLTNNPYTANETKCKNTFAAAATATQTALASPAQLASLMAAFNAQKATGYKTLRGYVFAQKYAEEKAKS